MKKFIHKYKNPNADRINYPLINRECDGNIVDYIVDSCKSLEVLEYIKFIGYTYNDDEGSVDTSEYITAKARSKMKNTRIKRYMLLDDSRYGELKLAFHIECNGESKDIVKKILIPIPDRDNYYLIKGTRYILMYQVVDNSTYTTKKNLTLKSMMPVSIMSNVEHYKDYKEVPFYAPIYSIQVFSKDINIIIFYFAKFGVYNALRYLTLDKIIKFVPSVDETRDDVLYFGISSKMYIEVNKYFFEKYQYTRTMTFMILSCVTNRLTFDNLEDKDFWITLIGSFITSNKNAQHERGLNTLVFFDRMLDNTTKRILKVHDMHKQNIYSILRWMIMEFDNLRRKDNLDLNNRRLRCNEYIAALLTKTFSERVNRVIAMGKKATLAKVEDIFKFQGDILITQLHKSNLLRFDDRVKKLALDTLIAGNYSLGYNY